MRYRQLSPTGDYTLGLPFLVNSAQCVAQACVTRLKLWQGEWFLDITDGTPWLQSILGRSQNPDAYIKQRILGTPGVTGLQNYSSSYNGGKRSLTVQTTVLTLYGSFTLTGTVNNGSSLGNWVFGVSAFGTGAF
jgi:hypothetical protein